MRVWFTTREANTTRNVRNDWQIGSGPVESARKTVVGNRLKGGGMRSDCFLFFLPAGLARRTGPDALLHVGFQYAEGRFVPLDG